MIKIAIELLKLSNKIDGDDVLLSTEMEMLSDMLRFSGLDEVLDEMGLSFEMMEFIKSQDSKDAGRMIGLLKQRPDITIDELKERVQKKEKTLNDKEKMIINRFRDNPEFYQWLEREIRRSRIQQKSEHEHLYTWGELSNIPDLRLIFDWFDRNDINISSYTFEAANENQKLWHKQFGKSKRNYGKTNPANIVYGPKWKNPEFDGWTVQLITTEKDLKAEGDKLEHCVGEYWSEVEEGELEIYSLRDPDNHPYVTIGVNAMSEQINTSEESSKDVYQIEQMYGYQNSLPADEIKPMLREWIQSRGDLSRHEDDVYDIDGVDISKMEIDQLSSYINDLKDNGSAMGEYGEVIEIYNISKFYNDLYSSVIEYVNDMFNKYSYDKTLRYDEKQHLNQITNDLISIAHNVSMKEFKKIHSDFYEVVAFINNPQTTIIIANNPQVVSIEKYKLLQLKNEHIKNTIDNQNVFYKYTQKYIYSDKDIINKSDMIQNIVSEYISHLSLLPIMEFIDGSIHAEGELNMDYADYCFYHHKYDSLSKEEKEYNFNNYLNSTSYIFDNMLLNNFYKNNDEAVELYKKIKNEISKYLQEEKYD